ncbi:DUF4276 family protein [uncultured Cardiobacterium sp.]|uniref:DUF4276 family protein n=1 Tax=uncultured Cardiobacterium sp. TaxID=417619 RepID=UPI00261EFE6B|nr:DUF4276 family protein [uncultured Cardiobacterium sp.]
MHIEFLVEDASGKKLLSALLPKLLDPAHTWRIHAYKGVGHIPPNLKGTTDPNKRILLDNLPRLLQGYANTPGIDAVVVLVDTDDRNCAAFLAELNKLAAASAPTLTVLIRLAIEEIEAWYLGDKYALSRAYPAARQHQDKLKRYQPDSICGPWELLANIIYPGGAAALKRDKIVGSKNTNGQKNCATHGATKKPLAQFPKIL